MEVRINIIERLRVGIQSLQLIGVAPNARPDDAQD
jgi:hypothetical protein